MSIQEDHVTPPEPRPLTSLRTAALESLDFLEGHYGHAVFEDGSDGFDHFIPIRRALEAATPAAEAGPLRTALEAARSELTARGGYGWTEALAVIEHALATPAAEAGPEPGLDVERLQRAIEKVRADDDAEYPDHESPLWQFDEDRLARQLAAEYAALEPRS